MDPRDLARYAVITLLFGVVAIFGMKTWNKSKAEKALIIDLRVLTADASMFEQFDRTDAAATLLKTLLKLHEANSRFGLSTDKALDMVFQLKKDGILEQTDSSRERDNPRQALIRESLLRNLENAKRLGFFNESLSIDMLSRGEAPLISIGPATGKTPEIGFLIDPSVFPGAEKLIPNLVLRPPQNGDTPPDEFEVAQARRLADSLQDCQIIERATRDRILDHYENIGKEEIEEPEVPEEPGEPEKPGEPEEVEDPEDTPATLTPVE